MTLGTRIDLGTVAESRPGQIGPIKLGAKHTGKRCAGNPHAAFDVAGAGNGVTVGSTRARRGKPRIQTRADLLGHRASPRPYLPGGCVGFGAILAHDAVAARLIRRERFGGQTRMRGPFDEPHGRGTP